MQIAIPTFGPFPVEQDRLRELIRQAKRGDRAAFETLVSLHERRVLRLAQRLLLNRDAAQDAAQEAFLKLYAKLGSIEENRNLEAWLYRVTANICLSTLRNTKSHIPLTLIVEPFADDLNPEQNAARAEQNRAVLAALRELSPRERTAIVLRDLEGYSTAQVASVLGSSQATVRSQISTGRVKLRASLLRQSRGGANE